MPEYFTSAIVLIALFACFIGLVVWAWSKNRNASFTQASQLPLEDDVAYMEESQASDISIESNDTEASKG